MKNKETYINELSSFPEEITEDGIRIYGETSYEHQIAVLSHYLHNNREEVDDERNEEIYMLCSRAPEVSIHRFP